MLRSIWNYVSAELRAIASACHDRSVRCPHGSGRVSGYPAVILNITLENRLGAQALAARAQRIARRLQLLPGRAKARIGALEDQLEHPADARDPRTLTVSQRQALIDHADLNGVAFLLTIEEKCPDCRGQIPSGSRHISSISRLTSGEQWSTLGRTTASRRRHPHS